MTFFVSLYYFTSHNRLYSLHSSCIAVSSKRFSQHCLCPHILVMLCFYHYLWQCFGYSTLTRVCGCVSLDLRYRAGFYVCLGVVCLPLPKYLLHMTSIYICMLSNRFALFRCIPNILICFLCRAVLNVHTTLDCNSKHVIARCFVHCIVLLAMSVQTSHIGNAVCHCHEH